MGKNKTLRDFIFLGSKINADGDCNYEIKRCLLLGRKVMSTLDSIFKSRDVTLPAKVHLVKAMVFPVVMYGCDSWTIKKIEHRRIDAFKLWCWRRLLRVPWTARSSQWILKEIKPECSLEGLMLKRKLQYILPPASSPALNLSQHQGLFQWVSSSHQVAKVLELQLQHQFFQWIFTTDFL